MIGNAIGIDTDGKIYKASNAGLSCVGFAIISASVDEEVRYIISKAALIPEASLEPSKTVYLSADGEVSTDIPSYTVSNIFQQLGTAKDANTVIVNINEPLIFE